MTDTSSSAAITAAARRRRKIQADLDSATMALGQALLDAVLADDGQHMGDHARAAGISRTYAWKLARSAAEASGRPMPRRRSRPNGR